MAADWTVKQGDTFPTLTDVLTYSDDSPANLTNATVTFVMRSLAASAPLALTGTVTVYNATAGGVSFTPSAQDTSTPGMYMANWVVDWNDGTQMTFPTIGYLWVSVEENLTTTGGAQLVGLPDVKDYLNIPSNDRTRDAKLIRFIHAVRPIVEHITGPIIPQVFEEWHQGGGYFVNVRRRPSTGYGTTPILNLIGAEEFRGVVKFPLAIVADPSQGSTYSVMLDNHGTITRRTAGGGVTAFPNQPNAVHIWYQAGQASVPANVYEGTLELLRVNYQQTQQTGRGRGTIADDTDTGPSLGFFVPRRVRELLSPNRKAPSIA